MGSEMCIRDSDEIGGTISIADDVCIKCGLCSQTCPWNAVFIAEKKPAKRAKTINAFDLELSKCIGCNTCVEACPGDFIKANSANLSVLIPDACAACQLCVKLCPTDALSMDVEWAEGVPADTEGLGYDAEKCDFVGACANKCPTEAIRVVTKTGMLCSAMYLNHSCILTIKLHKLLVSSSLLDALVSKHQDFLRIFNSCKSVCYYKCGSVLSQLLK